MNIIGSMVLLMVVIATTCGCRPSLAPPVIDGNSAYIYAEALVGFGKRCSGTDAYMEQADYIAEMARRADAAVTTQDFTAKTIKGDIKFRNIIAEVKGSSDRFVIVSTHCDLKDIDDEMFQGANDGASGAAVMLEMLRVSAEEDSKPPVTIRFVFFDGEECMSNYSDTDGLWGSRYYVGKLTKSEREKCLGVINLDMVGDKDLLITIPVNGDSSLTDLIINVAEDIGCSQYFTRTLQNILDDHVPFHELGIPAVNLIDFQYGPANSYWHTGADRMDKISWQSLEIVGNVVFSAIWNIKK